MKKLFLFLLSLGIGVGVFWLVIGRIGWQAILQPLLLFRSWQGIAIFLLTLLIAIFHIWRWRFILRTQGYNFSLKGLGEIWSVGFAITYLTPIALLGGGIFMALGLRKKFSLPWQKSLASVAIFRILSLSIILLFLIFGFFAFLFLVGLPSEGIVLISAFIILAVAVVLILFYYRSFRRKSILAYFLKIFSRNVTLNHNNQAIIETEEEIFSFFKPKNKVMWQGLGLTLLAAFLDLARFWLIIFFLGGTVINGFQALAIFAFVHMAYALPLPAALGGLELSQTFTFGVLGLGADLGAVFSLILRAAELSLVFIGFFFLIKAWIKSRVLTWLLRKSVITKK